eukprot:TRINITY_DN4810_c0_g1_i1.p1 TRINITY_DN4810_c0_g1~~TRINITY_DN4810_c0_g1_i1.p1  ORF type:complete len:503 (+),score=98.38 TRINITY_DN4810_c0_g1_i1:789-2297(+)
MDRSRSVSPTAQRGASRLPLAPLNLPPSPSLRDPPGKREGPRGLPPRSGSVIDQRLFAPPGSTGVGGYRNPPSAGGYRSSLSVPRPASLGPQPAATPPQRLYTGLNPGQKTYTPPDEGMIYAPPRSSGPSPRDRKDSKVAFVLPGEAPPSPQGVPARGPEGKRAAPAGYAALADQGFSVLGFPCGARVQSRDDIYIGGEYAIPQGARGVVRGPSDDGDRTRLLVDFDNFHTAINVCPDEIVLNEPAPGTGGSGGGGADGGAATGVERRGAGLQESAAAQQAGFLASMARAHEKMLREVYYQKLKRGHTNRREKQLEQRVKELEAQLGGGATASPSPSPAGPSDSVNASGADLVDPPRGPLEANHFYDRYPEARPTRADLQKLEDENARLRARLQEIGTEASESASPSPSRSPTASPDAPSPPAPTDVSGSVAPEGDAPAPDSDGGSDVAPEGDAPAPPSDGGSDFASEGDAPAPDSPSVASIGDDEAPESPAGDPPSPPSDS